MDGRNGAGRCRDDRADWLLVHLFCRPYPLHADDFRHHFLKDRRCDLSSIIDALRVVDDDEDQEPRVFQRTETDKGADILAVGVPRTVFGLLLSRPGLAAKAIAFDFGTLASANGNFFAHELTDGFSRPGVNRLSDFFRFCLFINGSVRIVDFFDQERLHHVASVGDGTESLYHLEGRDGDALADPHSSRIDDGHLIRVEQDAFLFT